MSTRPEARAAEEFSGEYLMSQEAADDLCRIIRAALREHYGPMLTNARAAISCKCGLCRQADITLRDELAALEGEK